MIIHDDRMAALAGSVFGILVGLGLWLYGHRLLGKLQNHFMQMYREMGAFSWFIDVMRFIFWLQRLSVRAFGLFGVCFGALMFFTVLGVVDGFELLDRFAELFE